MIQGMTPTVESYAKTTWLLADNAIVYKRPILPFAKYNILTELEYDPADDKWFHFTHTFTDSKNIDLEYAVINCRMVVKEPSGKTVKVSTVAGKSAYLKDYIKIKQ